MKRGDWIVCICKNWENFTYGKKYQVLSDTEYSLINVVNDIGEYPLPSLYGYDGPNKKVYYFATLEEWREMQIDMVLN